MECPRCCRNAVVFAAEAGAMLSLTPRRAPMLTPSASAFFECKPLPPLGHPRRQANPSLQGGQCTPLAAAEIMAVKDDSGNALPPMEQAKVMSNFLARHA